MNDGDVHTVALVRDNSEVRLLVDGGSETKLSIVDLEVSDMHLTCI